MQPNLLSSYLDQVEQAVLRCGNADFERYEEEILICEFGYDSILSESVHSRLLVAKCKSSANRFQLIRFE